MCEAKRNADGEVLFEEWLPPFVLNSTLRNHLQVMSFIWFIRVGVIFILILVGNLVIYGGEDVRYVAAIGGVLGVVLLLWASELHFRDMRLASTRVKLRSNGIEMYAFMYQRLLGFDGFVTRDDVASVEIVRGQLRQSVDYRSDLLWEDAPIGYLVVTTRGRRHPSGPKPPGQVIAMSEAMRMHWKVQVLDNGTGRGRMTKYVDGKPSVQ